MATRLARALINWGAQHGRSDLPWQHPATPYRVWVSEIMLQQTQVAVVVDYFQRFMVRFPDIPALAAADADSVMAQWAGLGYYARARNLHAAAARVVAQHGGALPDNVDALMALPGIGRSTAGAIVSLAYNRPAPLLDGNAKRVYARYFGVPGWPGEAAIARRLWAYAEQHTPADQPAAYAQAIMDLGATLCTRKAPGCGRCPLRGNCRAYAENAVECYPYPKPARRRPLRQTRMLVLRAGDAVLLEKRPPAGVWGGLWSLPEVPEDAAPEAHCRAALGLEPDTLQALPALRHGFTHFELEIQPLEASARPRGDCVMQDAGHVWYKLHALPGLPAPIKRLLDGL